MTGGNEKALQADQTLAMLLEFLARLEESESIKGKVIQEIKEKVEEYVKDVEQKFGNNGYLSKTISKSKELRSNIVKPEQKTQYQHYNTPFQEEHNDKYTQLLINNIFPLFGCLYYMYYECCRDGAYFEGGGMWQSEKCNGDQGPDLKNWLTDTTGGAERMIKRNYQQGDLSQNDGKKLFPNGSSTTTLLYYKDGAQLHYCLYYMLFLPENWNRGQSGHAVLFLEAFCQKVNDGSFNDHYKEDGISMEDLKSSCQGLKTKITVLISSDTIAPVATENTTVQYNDLLEPEHFSKYMDWIIKTFEELIKSLKEMVSDVHNWNKESLKTSRTFGPYPWGFTFKDGNWEENWESKKKEQLSSGLQGLTDALRTFKDALPSTSKGKGRSKRDTDSSSPASTVGSVIGGIGAVGAAAAGGAAYSGVLGPVAEAVGKFFKGLFL